ncbi:hypothetical protein CANTEDRAFT_114576 [Yamadazyma tenuis ATCC 10573]|uniref:Uncharacterized protein n=1 Tax=Candida tenuis (strain ATCC 10573 / BCRC 21748 / CBS 615 / JCM 9827 / NBRC 10315 / NRRL Y-1498 / VKM Y-70) TaxID=590646 RepID=G3B5Q4_CANTC|nr:uncharacterized protein CANTEDRAFT_114576 [Yamadazyma tenuis ATCC 10573]XP_006687402.1 uncharacterized protein CANTEDRAFT_114576 [Yamadazyma tenuis ATCC 10573]EGV63608.1 hypothetical protein CANTEDRAFT_114576 [Yamadazyma tenuis ATCC 10573]EGV63609.1 hypothetical protein CANTEDRAFT_114576 [Yamadazyma tenuis ATCC 10573]
MPAVSTHGSQRNQMNRSLREQLTSLCRTQQFYWFLGHLLTVVLFISNLAESIFSSNLKYYRMCLFSVIVTYVIVIKQIHFKNRTTIKNFTVAKFLKDENAQYFILSVWFYLVSYKIGKVSGALYSFVIYSIFHILSYFQSNILAYLSIGIQQEQKINNLIKRFVSQFNQYALMMAANSEIFIVISLALYSPLLMLRIFSQLPYIVIHFATLAIMIGFLKLRYTNSTFTRQILTQYDMKIQQVLATMPQLQQFLVIYTNIKHSIIGYLAPLDALVAPVAEKKNQ